MRKTHFTGFLKTAALLVFLLASCGAPEVIALPPTATPREQTPTPTIEATPALTEGPPRVIFARIHAPALDQSLLGEPADRILTIYLPPSYYTTQTHYPVVYYLPGFQHQDLPGVTLPHDPDFMVQDGTTREMIIVVAGGVNVLGGGFFVNSPVSGN